MTRARWIIGRVLPGLIAFLAVFGAWQWWVRAHAISELVLPAPTAILDNVIDHRSAYLDDARVTAIEALLGLALAAAISSALAVAMVHASWLRRAIDPVAIAVRCTPVVGLAPAFALWMGFGRMPKVIVAALITFPPLLVNLVTGLRSVDAGMLEVLRCVDASRREIFLKLRLPHAMPYAFSALKIAISLALVGAVVGEWAGSSEGLGYRIIRAQRDLETSTVWGAITVLATMGIASTLVVTAIEHRMLRWQHRH